MCIFFESLLKGECEETMLVWKTPGLWNISHEVGFEMEAWACLIA
jgi:hypothetical protein